MRASRSMSVTSPSSTRAFFWPAEDLAGRRGDLALGEDAGRDLVEQRLEQVVGGLGDHGDVDVAAPQRLGAEEPAEAGADDDDPVGGAHGRVNVGRVHGMPHTRHVPEVTPGPARAPPPRPGHPARMRRAGPPGSWLEGPHDGKQEAIMCRWLAYSGSPGAARGPALQAQELAGRPEQALADGRRRRPTATGSASAGTAHATRPGCSAAPSRRGTTATCASCAPTPRSRRVFAHIRASTGSAVQQTNCHPFRHGNWLWMHNGVPRAASTTMKRDLRAGGRPGAVRRHRGLDRLRDAVLPGADASGCATTRAPAVARAVGLVEEVGRSARHRPSRCR